MMNSFLLNSHISKSFNLNFDTVKEFRTYDKETRSTLSKTIEIKITVNVQ